MLTEAEVREALKVCYDPAFQINIVDLGRVAAIDVEPDVNAAGVNPRSLVRVELLPCSEEQDGMLTALVANRLLGMPAISRVHVSLAPSPAWTPDRMNDSARSLRGKQQGLIQLGGS